MTVDKENLRSLALTATKSVWTTDGLNEVMSAESDQINGGYVVAICEGPDRLKNAKYLAAASPATVLSLLAEIERLEAWRTAFLKERDAHICQRDQLKAENAGLRTGYQAYEDVNAGLKAQVEALRASMKEMCAMYTHVWDREDGALVCFSSNVERFDKAHEAAWALINPAKEAAHD
jgi:hypothetical protein